MTAHDWFVEHRADFVARTLEPDEARTFTEHLGGCADCRAGIAKLEQELAGLPMGPAAVPPRWLVPFALAASLALSLGAWFWALGTTRAFERQLAQERGRLVEELAMTRDTLGIIREAGMVRHASIRMGGRTGGLLTLPMPPNARNVMGAALTIEPMGASGAAPAGVELAHLMM